MTIQNIATVTTVVGGFLAGVKVHNMCKNYIEDRHTIRAFQKQISVLDQYSTIEEIQAVLNN